MTTSSAPAGSLGVLLIEDDDDVAGLLVGSGH
jgi:hypothetical protein